MMTTPYDSGVEVHAGEDTVRLRRSVDGARAYRLHERQALAVPVVVILSTAVVLAVIIVVGYAIEVSSRQLSAGVARR